MAIIAHITSKFDRLAPPAGTALYDRYNQFMALLATSVYPAYHRQHHCYYYGDEVAYESIRACARAEQALVFDYLEQSLPRICVWCNQLTAADFYLYMLSRDGR